MIHITQYKTLSEEINTRIWIVESYKAYGNNPSKLNKLFYYLNEELPYVNGKLHVQSSSKAKAV